MPSLVPLPSCHSHIRALRVNQVKPFLEAHHFNVHPTIALRKPIASTASLLYNNHHAGCLFPFRFGAGLVLDPLDNGTHHTFRPGGGQRDVTSPALMLYAKKRVGHAFPGATSATATPTQDKRLYSFPLKSMALQSQNSECCMWISIGLLFAYRWCARGQTQTSVGRLQRLFSFLRKKHRVSDALLRHALVKTAPYLRRSDKARLC